MQVGFCNLIKKAKDHTNHIWVADANENSAYYLNFDSQHCSHLRNAASSVRRWASNSSLVCIMKLYHIKTCAATKQFLILTFCFIFSFLQIIEKLKEKVLCIVGDCKA